MFVLFRHRRYAGGSSRLPGATGWVACHCLHEKLFDLSHPAPLKKFRSAVGSHQLGRDSQRFSRFRSLVAKRKLLVAEAPSLAAI